MVVLAVVNSRSTRVGKARRARTAQVYVVGISPQVKYGPSSRVDGPRGSWWGVTNVSSRIKYRGPEQGRAQVASQAVRS